MAGAADPVPPAGGACTTPQDFERALGRGVVALRSALERRGNANETEKTQDAPRLLVAVSGGADSLALLLIAHAALGQHMCAATVDHGLRAEAAHEAHHVAAICAACGIAHRTLTGALPATTVQGRNLHARARALRYRLLEAERIRCGADAIATAHHADDQAETLIMRLARGAGLGGLSAVRASHGRVVRPLLGWRRSELAELVRAAGLTPVDDPANHDPRFERTRVRQWLAEQDIDAEYLTYRLDPRALARSAAHLAEADQALEWVAHTLMNERLVRRGDTLVLAAADLPDFLQKRLIARTLSMVEDSLASEEAHALPAAHLGVAGAVLSALARGDNYVAGHVLVRPAADGWRFSPAPPRRPVATGIRIKSAESGG